MSSDGVVNITLCLNLADSNVSRNVHRALDKQRGFRRVRESYQLITMYGIQIVVRRHNARQVHRSSSQLERQSCFIVEWKPFVKLYGVLAKYIEALPHYVAWVQPQNMSHLGRTLVY